MNESDIEKLFKKYADKIVAKSDKGMERLSAESEERTQLYFQALEGRFNTRLESFREDVATKFAKVDDRFDKIYDKFNTVDARFDEIERKLDLIFEKVAK